MQLLILLLLPFIGSAIAALLPANARNREAWLAGIVTLAGAMLCASFYPQLAAGEVLRYQAEWMPSLGFNFALRVDGYAWLFAMLVLVIGLLVVLYARYYMSPADPVPRFFSFFLAFMGSMLGLVLSGNIIQMVLFWEMTSLTSFLLIGYWHHRADARRGARMALTVTGAGGLCLFAGVLLLGHIVGSYDLDVVLASAERVQSHPWYVATLVLISLGALTKSAQFPFHFWLPHAMAAPTPVSAYLHSATMVKAGVFLLTRFWPVLAGTEEWAYIISSAGLATLLIGAFLAIFQQDLKGLLAYSTISHLGLIVLLLGMGSPLAAVAAIFHTMNHATFKASLFMAAGIIDHETGTRDIRRLSGLLGMMPITATLAMVASAAMAGVPLMNGFISKEMFFAETVYAGGATDYRLPIAATIAGVFSVVYSLRFIHDVFFGPKVPENLPHVPHDPPRWMLFPVALLVLTCFVVGVAPALTIGPVLHLAAGSVLGANMPSYSLAVWHGFNEPLVMSLIALFGGTVLYFALQKHLKLGTVEKLPIVDKLDGKRAFDRTLVALATWAGRLEALLGTRRLQPQLFVILILVAVAAGWPLYMRGLSWGDTPELMGQPVLAILWGIGIVCSLGAAYQAKYHRLASLALMGGAGLVTCLTFVWFSAPDLALTQLMVETVTMVLILLGLRWLPPRLEPHEIGSTGSTIIDWVRRYRDLVLAIIIGGGIAALTYAVLTRAAPENLAPYFLTKALSEGGGRNVVNVILVDFRGFDTMGEITVLAIVALTVFALLRRFRPAPESTTIPLQQIDAVTGEAGLSKPAEDAESGHMLIPALFMRMLFPIMVMVSIFFFMRGHNAPGGGFVAGLIFAVALILQYMAGGAVWVENNLSVRPRLWIGMGLLFALFTGLGSWVVGYPFLTSTSPHPVLPYLGEVPFPSAFVFDLGVFTLVVGATTLILIALAHQSVRSHRKAQGAPATVTATLNTRKVR